MKKILMLLGLGLLAATGLQAALLSPEEAYERLGNGVKRLASLSQPELKMTVNSPDGLPALYIFGAQNNEGYMILSADDAATPMVGYSDKGRFEEFDMSPSFKAWLEEYGRQIEFLRMTPLTRPIEPEALYPSDWVSISPKLTTKWNQTAPYNNQCPTSGGEKCVTGCVATAMAQVMKFFEYPERGKGQISYTPYGFTRPLSINLSEQEFDWDNMLDTYLGNYNETEADAVAYLMRACGYSVLMDYNPYSSGANERNLVKALINNFSYSSQIRDEERLFYTTDEWVKQIYDNLLNLGPVIYGANSISGGGHQFIVDGYDGEGYFHINWGWGGVSDGYFLLDLLTPAAQGVGGYGSGYNIEQSAILGIFPDDGATTDVVPYLTQRGNLTGFIENDNLYVKLEGETPLVANTGIEDIKVQLGMLVNLADENEGNAVFYDINVNEFEVRAGYGFNYGDFGSLHNWPALNLNSVTMDEGVGYKFTFATRDVSYPQGEGYAPIRPITGMCNYVIVTKENGSYNCESFDRMKLNVEFAEFLAPLYGGLQTKINAIFNNPYPQQLSPTLSPVLLNENSEIMFMGDTFIQTVDAKSSVDNEMNVLFSKINGVTAEIPGTYYLGFYDFYSKELLEMEPLEVIMEEYNEVPKIQGSLEIENATWDNGGYLVDSPNLLELSLSLTVEQGYFYSSISIYVMELSEDGTKYQSIGMISLEETPALSEGESGTYKQTSVYEGLIAGKDYYLYPVYYIGNTRYDILGFVKFIMSESQEPDEPDNEPTLPKPAITPAPGTLEAGWFDTFSIRWGYNNLELLNPGNVSVTKDGEELEILDVRLVESQMDEDSPIYETGQLVVTLADLQMDSGVYTIIIPANTVNVFIDNKALPNEDIEFSYIIESQVVPELPDYSVNPEPGIVDSLSEISINWNEDQLNINESWEYEISFTDASGNSYISHIPELRFEGEQEEGSLGNVLVIKIDPEITDPGEYTLRIPEGFLFVNDPQTGTLPSQEIILVYVIEESGVGILINSDANGMFNIYDMQGRLLKSTKEFNDIRELTPGFYIINGKKVVVK